MNFSLLSDRRRVLLLLNLLSGGGKGISVSGTSPITLANAVKGKLKKLLQYGKCSVSDGVITCNNGELSWGLLTDNLLNVSEDNESKRNKGTTTQFVYGENRVTIITDRVEAAFLVWPFVTVTEDDIGKTFIFSGHNDDNDADRLRVVYTTNGWANVGDFSKALSFAPYTIVADDVGKTYGIRFYNATGKTKSAWDLMVNWGETAKPYVPYQEGIITTGTAEEVAVTGENLFDKDNAPYESSKLISADGSIVSNGAYVYFQNYIPVAPNTAYVFSGVWIGQSAYNSVAFYDAEKTFISRFLPSSAGVNAQFTTPSNCHYIRFNAGYLAVSDENLGQIQLSVGATAPSEYHPYTGETVPVTFRTDTINQWDEEWEVGGIVNATGLPYSANDSIRSKNFCKCQPSTSYYCTKGTNVGSIYWYDANKDYISYEGAVEKVVTSPSNAAYFKYVIGNTTTYGNNLAVNYPSSETSYHPYLTTVYGGHMRINMDGSVDLVGTNASKDMGTLTYTKSTSTQNYTYFEALVSDKAGNFNYLSSSYEVAKKNRNELPNNSIGVYYPSTDPTSAYWKRICVRDNDHSALTAEEFKTVVAGIQFVYELEEYVIYHLPSVDALVAYDGVNNAWHSANGKITVALAEADIVEQGTPQPIRLSEGTNTITVTANVEGIQFDVLYKGNQPEASDIDA